MQQIAIVRLQFPTDKNTLKQPSDIHRTDLEPPIFVTDRPFSGTTHLLILMVADPRLRSLLPRCRSMANDAVAGDVTALPQPLLRHLRHPSSRPGIGHPAGYHYDRLRPRPGGSFFFSAVSSASGNSSSGDTCRSATAAMQPVPGNSV